MLSPCRKDACYYHQMLRYCLSAVASMVERSPGEATTRGSRGPDRLPASAQRRALWEKCSRANQEGYHLARESRRVPGGSEGDERTSCLGYKGQASGDFVEGGSFDKEARYPVVMLAAMEGLRVHCPELENFGLGEADKGLGHATLVGRPGYHPHEATAN